MAEVVVLDVAARYEHHIKVCDQCWHAKYCWDMCPKGQAFQQLASSSHGRDRRTW